jgi:hypothetical protein
LSDSEEDVPSKKAKVNHTRINSSAAASVSAAAAVSAVESRKPDPVPFPYSLGSEMPSKNALTVDEELMVHDALNFPNSEAVVLRKFPGLLIDTHGLTYGQLRCLSLETSLNDQIMNTYFALLQRLSKQALVLDTFFFKRYQMRNQKDAYRMVHREVPQKIRQYQVHELYPTFLYL